MSFSLLDTTRQPTAQLLALNADGTTLADLSADLISFDLTFTDELKSHQASLYLQNTQGKYDKYGDSASAGYLAENTLLSLQKGFVDLATGTVALYPAFTGRVVHARAGYSRNAAGDITGEIIQADCFDLMKLLLKQRITSDPYYNTNVNVIAADLITRYGDPYSKRLATNFAATDYALGFVQFPDFAIAEAIGDLFDPILYFFWFGYDGRATTRPRLGAGGSPLLGYPDALTAPSPDFTLPDAQLVEIVTPEWQDYEFVNQVRVLGRALAETVSLGPCAPMVSFGDSVNYNFIAPRAGITHRIYFTQNSGGQNQTTASNVYLKIYDPSFLNSGPTPYKWIATVPGLVQDSEDVTPGAPIPYPVYEQAYPPGHQNVKSVKSDGRLEGGVALIAAAPNFVDIQVFANTDGGGFEWGVEVHGQTVLTAQQTLTAIVDLAPVSVTGETLTDAFGDHQTYQMAHAPIAMGTPVSAAINGASIGTNAADGTQIDARYAVDFERGRIVLTTRAYEPYSADELFTGGTAGSTGTSYDLTYLASPAPLAVYQSYRQAAFGGTFSYALTGLEVGRGYTIRLHLADPTSTADGQRVFAVYANGVQSIASLDIHQLAQGNRRAVIQEMTGVLCDPTGLLTLTFQNGTHGGQADGGAGSPMVCGIEIILPQGTGGVAYAINCGGAAITPTVPVVTASYAWSPNQQAYNVSNLEINDPLLNTYAQCLAVGQYNLNKASWARSPLAVQTASLPTLAPGQVLKFFHPRIGANGADVSLYVQSLVRHSERPPAGSSQQATDYDTYSGYLLYRAFR